MREPLSSLLGTPARALTFVCASHILQVASAISFKSIPSPNLDIGNLGRVAFAGDFDSISLYQYEGQSEASASTENGALLSRYPNGVFATLNETDADIKTMCPFTSKSGYQGVIFGGNFTSVGGLHTPGGIALLNTTTGIVSPLEGLNGSVSTVYCDSGRVYVGGSFTGGNSTNAIVYEDKWVDMPFSGFNGPIHSITKTPNNKIIFGGEFNGLGGNATAPKQNNSQVLPIGSATLSQQSSLGPAGLNEPSKIVCKSDPSSEGTGLTWLLPDNSPGFWQAKFDFGFTPTMLRLHNTKFQGRGTKTWRYTALPDGGIMNLTYVDSNGQKKFCDARCPLPEGDTSAQDFEFVNNVGMNSFRIDVSDWYGPGGGLNGIELFQDEIFTFAIDRFNEPTCGGVKTGAKSTTTGEWVPTPSHNSNSMYLTANLEGQNINPDNATVVFQPDIKQAGNYTVYMFTPGCRGDNTCATRGRVNITWALTKTSEDRPSSTELYQTNEFDKYDTIYMDMIDPADGFRPSVTLSPMPGQSGPLTVVAQKVRFELANATAGGLNGIFEYDPTVKEINTDFSESKIDTIGAELSPRERAVVSTVATNGNRLYVGGKFSGDGFSNIFAIENESSRSLPGNGLNSQVMTIYSNASSVYVGGNFTNTQDNGNADLRHVALFRDNKWIPLGAGVNGAVVSIVPFQLNITANKNESVLAITGFFNQVNKFANHAAHPANGFAVWVPSQNNWLNNLNVHTITMHGSLMAYADVPGSDPVFAGSMSSQALGASGAVTLNPGNPLTLGSFPSSIKAQQQQSPLSKRALSGDLNSTAAGIVTAIFCLEDNMNKTILGGHFAAKSTVGQNITNLLIIDGKDKDRVEGLDPQEIDSNSTFAALAVQDGILYAGGSISGTVNNARVGGVLTYDLADHSLTKAQPPALQGNNVVVNAISPRPKSKEVYVGGSFQSAGALSCSTLCVWNGDRNQWTSPGGDLSGDISYMMWLSDKKLLIAGNLTSGNNQTKIMTYDLSNRQFEAFAGAENLPGPVTALTPATKDGTDFWASGRHSDGSPYLQRYRSKSKEWLPIRDLFGQGTNIRSIQVLKLSKEHSDSNLIEKNQDLLILGQINITNFGTASAALFNGTDLVPFLLSTTSNNEPGSIGRVFVEKPENFLEANKKHLALGFIVLIALAIALFLTFFLVVAGILLEWYRKKSKGYSPAPTGYPDRAMDTARIPPEHLFGTLQGNRAPAI